MLQEPEPEPKPPPITLHVFYIIQYYSLNFQQSIVDLERRLYPHNRRFMERSDARLHRPYGETTKQK